MTVTAPTTTEEILREDGAEAALVALAEKVGRAEEAIRRVLRESSPDRVWTVRELQDAAAGDLSSSVMSIAYLRLLKAGELQVDHASARVEAVAA